MSDQSPNEWPVQLTVISVLEIAVMAGHSTEEVGQAAKLPFHRPKLEQYIVDATFNTNNRLCD